MERADGDRRVGSRLDRRDQEVDRVSRRRRGRRDRAARWQLSTPAAAGAQKSTAVFALVAEKAPVLAAPVLAV